jgi:hypothetical protein
MFGKVGPKGDFLLPVHRMDLFFPSPDAFRNRYNLTEAQIEKLGELEYFIKCKTSRGKTNLETYSVKSCVNPGPDLTAPTISERSQPANGAFVKHGIEEQPIRIYVNEPAECRWDNEEVGYNQMSNQLNCEDDIEKYTLYGLPCTTTLTNLQNNSKVYIKCLDQPWWAGTENESKRNPMEEGFEFEVFISEEPLVIDDVRPEEGSIIIEGFQPVSRPLKLSTSGGVKDGKSVCSFKISDDYYSTFPETNASLHVQKLDSLMEGKYNIEFFCQDVAGNNATSSTEFRIQIDSFGPRVVRVYYESGGLKIITTEPAECRYDFKRNFIFENATSMSVGETTEHYADWALRTYYIQCEDEYNNKGAKFKVKGYELS